MMKYVFVFVGFFFYFWFLFPANADEKNVALVLYYGTSYMYKEAAPSQYYQKSFDTTTFDDKQAFIDKINDLVKNPNSVTQLIIPIHTHGSDLPHQIVLQDMLDLNEIKPQLQALLNRGVKIGILDFSCFSKQSLSLKDQFQNSQNFCMITGDSQEIESLDFFSHGFLEQIRPQASLEDVFLKARLSEPQAAGPVAALTLSDTPGISTEEGQKTLADLSGVQEIMALRSWSAVTQRTIDCNDSPFVDLEKLSKNVSDVTGTAFDQTPEFKKLKSDLEDTQNFMKQSLAQHPGLKDEFNITETIDGESMTRRQLANYFQSSAYLNFMEHFKEVAERTDPPYQIFNLNSSKSVDEAMKTIDAIKMSDEDRTWVKQALPHHIQISARFRSLMTSDKNFPLLSDLRVAPPDLAASYGRALVSGDERKIYDMLYRSRLKNDTSSDACRDIKF